MKTIYRMKVKRREQHMRSFLVRSDNAICLPDKKDCVKIGKEKKQVYVFKESVQYVQEILCRKSSEED